MEKIRNIYSTGNTVNPDIHLTDVHAGDAKKVKNENGKTCPIKTSNSDSTGSCSGKSSSYENANSCTVANVNSCTVANVNSCTVANVNSCTVANVNSCTVGNGNNCTVGNGNNCTVGNGNNCTVGNGNNCTVGNGNNCIVGYGNNCSVVNGNNFSVGIANNCTVVNGNNCSVANGSNCSVANGSNCSVVNGNNYSVANENNYSVANGNNCSVVNGNNYSVANENNYSVANENNYSVANGNNYSVTNGNNCSVVNGNNCSVVNGNNYSVANGNNYSVGIANNCSVGIVNNCNCNCNCSRGGNLYLARVGREGHTKAFICKRLIVFDYDDTILPTSWITVKMKLSLYDVIPENIKQLFTKLSDVVINTLSLCLTQGKLVIVTNASLEWLINSAKKFLPLVWSFIMYNNIRIISARDRLINSLIDPKDWKKVIFYQIINEILSPYLYNTSFICFIYSVGDGNDERNACFFISQLNQYSSCIFKSLKFLAEPTCQKLIAEHELFYYFFNSTNNISSPDDTSCTSLPSISSLPSQKSNSVKNA
ncbi:HAD domain ookinete protein, putative [Plasmodium ovale]|uniref:HAD domain ookinete protein, putative n=1 Tax=Plasmodium ovale TaxID=36330 RepID=A0A1D3TLY9_PLAOA|nr:HAD domain ookinete protein, putative [Plasmodium ovale]